jgi:hypothetical protein
MTTKENNPPTSVQFTPTQRDWLQDRVNETPAGSKLSMADIVRASVEAAMTKQTVIIVRVQTAYGGNALDFLLLVKKAVEKFKIYVRDVKAVAIFGDENCRKKSWELVSEAERIVGEIRRLVKLVGGLSVQTLFHTQKIANFCDSQTKLAHVSEEEKKGFREIVQSLVILEMASDPAKKP